MRPRLGLAYGFAQDVCDIPFSQCGLQFFLPGGVDALSYYDGIIERNLERTRSGRDYGAG